MFAYQPNKPQHDIHQSGHWSGTDREEVWHENMQIPERREYFQKRGWDRPDAIYYRINQQGFRGDDFDESQEHIVTFGCSFTFGVGLSEEQTWPYMLAKYLNLPVYNLALGGASADRCYSLAEYWLPKLKPRAVYMLTPFNTRLDIINGDFHQTILPNATLRYGDDVYWRSWIATSQNGLVNQRRNQAAVAGLCHALGIPLRIYRIDDAIGVINYIPSTEQGKYQLSHFGSDRARDWLHRGPLWQEFVTENMLGSDTKIPRIYCTM